jgi:hypothetical protein
MNIGAILVGIALLVLAGTFVARPLFKRQTGGNGRRAISAGPRARLTTRRDAIYALIRELDADFQTGKINAQDHQSQRQFYVAEAVSLMKQLDALASDNGRSALEAEIEARVLALREPVARFCTRCGQRADFGDSFCGHCGAALKKVV